MISAMMLGLFVVVVVYGGKYIWTALREAPYHRTATKVVRGAWVAQFVLTAGIVAEVFMSPSTDGLDAALTLLIAPIAPLFLTGPVIMLATAWCYLADMEADEKARS
jgi:hypothetical protein